MKSILEGREGLKAVIYQIAEVTGYLWQKGWAERNGGNITVNVTEFMDDECKAMKAISEVKQIGMVLPLLKGKYFYPLTRSLLTRMLFLPVNCPRTLPYRTICWRQVHAIRLLCIHTPLNSWP